MDRVKVISGSCSTLDSCRSCPSHSSQVRIFLLVESLASTSFLCSLFPSESITHHPSPNTQRMVCCRSRGSKQPTLFFIMVVSSSPSPRSLDADPFARSSTLTDLDAISREDSQIPSPQAWLVKSKRGATPSLLDPPGSPLDLLLPVSEFCKPLKSVLTQCRR